MITSNLRLLAAVGVAFCAAPALAQDEDIVVTATRAEQSADETGQAITLIDRALIEQRQAVIVSDLLATTPGVTVSRNGPAGGFTGVRIRGAEAEQTLVLIDGVRVNDPSAPGGGYDFGNLLAGTIERIEVLRGPNSVPWGSQAIGGVVNIVTTRPTGDLSLNASGEYGWRDSAQAVANAGFGTGPVKAGFGAGWFRTDGHSAAAVGTERDGYERFGANGRVEVALSEAIAIDLRGYYAHGETELDGFPPPAFAFADTAEFSTAQELLGYAGVRARFGRLANRLAFTISDVNRDNFNAPGDDEPAFIARGRVERLEYQGDWRASDAVRAVFGAEIETSRFGDGFERFSTGIDSFYGQLIVNPLEALTLTGGARHDNHEDFGGETTFGGNAALDLGATLVRASYAEGFKAPTLFQLRSSFGNETLQPERARSFDVGVEQRLLDGAVMASATWFSRRTRNQIDFISCFGNPDPICADRPFGTYANIARTRGDGVELALDVRPAEALSVNASFSYIDTENRSPDAGFGDNFGNVLARRPKHSASLSADYAAGRGLSFGATLLMVGDSFDDAANAVPIDGYTLAGVRAAWAIDERFELYGRIENLFDERYQTVATYGAAGRAAYLGLRAKLR